MIDDYILVMFFLMSFLYIFVFFWYIELYLNKKNKYGILALWSEIFQNSKKFWKELVFFFTTFLLGSFIFIILVGDALYSIIIVLYIYFPIMYLLYWLFVYPKSLKVKKNEI